MTLGPCMTYIFVTVTCVPILPALGKDRGWLTLKLVGLYCPLGCLVSILYWMFSGGHELLIERTFYFVPSSVQFSHSVMSKSLQPPGLNMPGFPVHHQLPELVQTHVHWVSDAIQPSHPLSSPSPLAFNLSQHQGLFHCISSHQVAKILKFQPEHQYFQWIFRTNFLYNRLVGSPCNPRDSQESSPAPQFKSINSSALSFSFFFFGAHCYSHVPIPDYLVSNLSIFLFPRSCYIFCLTHNSYIFKLVHQGHFSKLFLLGEFDHYYFLRSPLSESTVHFWCIHIHSFNVYWKPTLCANCFARVWESKRKKEQSY